MDARRVHRLDPSGVGGALGLPWRVGASSDGRVARRLSDEVKHERVTLEDQLKNLTLIAGNPKQVIEKLRIYLEETRPSILALWGNDGRISHADSMSYIKLMGQEVLPACAKSVRNWDSTVLSTLTLRSAALTRTSNRRLRPRKLAGRHKIKFALRGSRLPPRRTRTWPWFRSRYPTEFLGFSVFLCLRAACTFRKRIASEVRQCRQNPFANRLADRPTAMAGGMGAAFVAVALVDVIGVLEALAYESSRP